MNRRTLGISYAVVTGALIASITLSFVCWSVPGRKTAVHHICLTVWVISGVALASWQVVLVIAALRMQRGGTRESSSATGRVDPIQTLVMIFAVVIMLAIGLFVYALSGMPS